MPQPTTSVFPECAVCTNKTCERAPVWKLDICQFGISYVNDGEKIQRQNASTTLRHLSQNLRHELNKILQLIINQASELDPTISLNNIAIDSPTDRIVAATVMLDNFIEMIAGVNDFQPGLYGDQPINAVPLAEIVTKYDRIYSLIRNPKRASDIRISLLVPKILKVNSCRSIIEYLIAVLIDNIRKYSLETTVVRIFTTASADAQFVDLAFENVSVEIKEPEKLFHKGYQQDPESGGFGFGLFWATILVDHYNKTFSTSSARLELVHEQLPIDRDYGICAQRFTIKNLKVSK